VEQTKDHKAVEVTDREKFEARMTVTPGCWLWNGTKDYKGYGVIYASKRRRFAHRFSYELYVGEIPPGLCICHKCDNPGCVNPDHLWAGTNQENVDDKMKKGRWGCGERKPGQKLSYAKLQDSDIYAIRADARCYTAIARQYGVMVTHIRDIKLRLAWAHLPPREDEKPSVDGRGHKPKLNIEQQSSIRSDDRVQTVIAAEYGVSQAVISQIKLGRGCYASIK